jgi:hypothetical protein
VSNRRLLKLAAHVVDLGLEEEELVLKVPFTKI